MRNKIWRRTLSVALAAVLTVGALPVRADALNWNTAGEDYGQLIQPVVNEAQGLNGYSLIQQVPVGSTVRFDETVRVGIYAEDAAGRFVPQMQGSCMQWTFEDTQNTYVFFGEDGSVCMFRGSDKPADLITMAGDHERNFSLKLSQPALGITVEELTLRTVNPVTGEVEPVTGNYLVYEVAKGTRISAGFGEVTGLMLGSIWDTDGVQMEDAAMLDLAAQQFPGAQKSFLGMPLCPVELTQAGYYYQFLPVTIACSPPVFKVVEEPAPEKELRTAVFGDMNWSAYFVERVYAHGWMDGMGGDRFSPESSLTVAQALTLAARLHAAQYNCVIPAVDGPWYQSFFEYCKRNGVLAGFDADEIYARINTEISRVDMVKILDGAARVTEVVNGGIRDGYVPDVREWLDDGGSVVYRWYRAGIVSGRGTDHSFCPNDSIARGEVAVILCQLLDLV